MAGEIRARPERQDLSDALGRPHDGNGPGASFLNLGIGLPIIALMAGTVFGLIYVDGDHAGTYVLVVLGVLGIVGLLALVAMALGILRLTRGGDNHLFARTIIDTALDGILVTDQRGRVCYANKTYLDLIGATNNADVRPIERVFMGDPDVSEVIYRLLKAAREGRPLQEEVRLGGASGDARWLRMRVRPLADLKNSEKFTVWSIADVTREHEQHENVFQELQQAIDYLDHAPAGFFSVDAMGDVVYLNATLATWLDYDLAEVGVGALKLSHLIAGGGAALLTTLPAAPGEVKTELLDLDLRTRSGKPLPVRLFHKVAHGMDGRPGSSRTLVLNREEDKGSDPQRLAEVRFMRFFQNAPIAIATIDKSGRIVRSNARFVSAFKDFFQGDERLITSVVAARDRPALEALVRKASEGHLDIPQVEAALTGERERWANFFVSAVAEDDRDGETAIVYAFETTAQRSLESRFYQQQKMESVGQLAGGIAHDFNNVLSAIMMATDFLLNAHKPTDPSFKDIMQIKQNANRAAALVRHLLAFSRKQTLRPQVLEFGEVLHDLGMLLKRLIGEKIALEIVHGRDPWLVKVDISQLEQVIVNLAVNARDAMPDGGRLTIRTANISAVESVEFHAKGMPTGDYVLLEVVDTGTGIPPDIIDKIFEPFFTTKEIGKGTGLGLSTVYGIVKQTGGFIFAESQPGQTRFRIFLPRHLAEAEGALPETSLVEAAAINTIAAADSVIQAINEDLTGRGTILLVEDEEGLRALNARGLSSRGYTVLEASNGLDALAVLDQQGRVDLVVSDVVMPEMDGPSLLKELRQRDPGVKFIFVSGYAEDAFANLPTQEKYGFLPKPFTLKQLVTEVKKTLAQ
jgi:two-component system, cell cycle sensor histidine kinase and response regulator CckA